MLIQGLANPDEDPIAIWSGCKSLILSLHLPIIHVTFIQYLTYPVTEFVIVYTVLQNFQYVLSQLKQDSIISLFCDEKVFHIVPEIIFQRPEELQNSERCRSLSWKTFKGIGF